MHLHQVFLVGRQHHAPVWWRTWSLPCFAVFPVPGHNGVYHSPDIFLATIIVEGTWHIPLLERKKDLFLRLYSFHRHRCFFCFCGVSCKTGFCVGLLLALAVWEDNSILELRFCLFSWGRLPTCWRKFSRVKIFQSQFQKLSEHANLPWYIQCC